VALSFSASSVAYDASRNATEVQRSGRWLLIEFAAKEQLVYRVTSQSTNSEDSFIAFDFAPSENCVPIPAVMSSTMKAYSTVLDQGLVPFSYRLPGQGESTELTKTEMARGDNVAFFQFKQLTAMRLLKSQDKGSLALWVPASSDGSVHRSGNIYFSLAGYSAAYQGALQRCKDSR
jgi:hypothetical protein